MENVTHSLIGVVLGEAIARRRQGGEPVNPTHRAALLWTAVLGNNMPDFDFLMQPFVGQGNLGYLLHHRGYTHTLLMSLPLALVPMAVGRWISRKDAKGPLPRATLFLASWLGILCHVTADFWNDYGVHPFWPAVDRWYYGGMIFILEPLIWLALLPFAYSVSRSLWGRGVNAFLGVAVVAAAWGAGFVPGMVSAWITLWGAAFALVQWRAGKSLRPAVAGLASVLCAFAIAGGVVRAQLDAARPAGEEKLQTVTSPAPGNPLCWRVIVSGRKGDDYVARMGIVSLLGDRAGQALSAGGCFNRGITGERTATLVDVSEPGLLSLAEGGHAQWAGEFRGNLGELRALAANHCRIRAYMRYARVPFWVKSDPKGDSLLLGDLRFDREKGLGFAEIESSAGEECFRFEPSWEGPGFGLLF